MMNRILIIDDDRAIAQLTSIWLRAAGFETQTAFGGEEGLRTASTWKPDVMLLDIRMPGIDGFEVYARMKVHPELANIPVIYLSANVQEAARKEAMAAGAVAFLAKPYETEHVLRVVHRALRESAHPKGEESHHV